MTPTPLRLFYVDDSGAPDTGFVVYSWIEMQPEQWRGVLRSWLDFRKQLYVRYKIPPAEELHSTKFVGGRAHPSTDPAVNASKSARRRVMRLALEAIGQCSDLKLGTVYSQTPARGQAYQRERERVYADFIQHLDTRLDQAAELGMVFMDGDGTDGGYYNAHRGLKLAHRRVIEDPLFQVAHRSQLVQMADIVAWTTYQSLLRHPGKQFAWGWYAQYLKTSDINGGPIQL